MLRLIDAAAHGAARLGMAAVAVLLAVTLTEVVARYGFAAPTVWGSDLATMVNAAIFLAGAAWTLREGGHVRIDFLSARLPARLQNAIAAAFHLLVLAPVLALIARAAWRSAASAWRSGEVDLAMAWKVPVWPMRALVAACLTLLLLQVLAEAARHLAGLRSGRLPASLGTPGPA